MFVQLLDCLRVLLDTGLRADEHVQELYFPMELLLEDDTLLSYFVFCFYLSFLYRVMFSLLYSTSESVNLLCFRIVHWVFIILII